MRARAVSVRPLSDLRGFLTLLQKPLAVRLWRLLGSVRLEGPADLLVLGATLGHKWEETVLIQRSKEGLSSPVLMWMGGWTSLVQSVRPRQGRPSGSRQTVSPNIEGVHTRWAVQPSSLSMHAGCLPSTPRPPKSCTGYKARTDSHLLRTAGPSCPVLSRPQQQASSSFPYFRVI